MIIQADRIIVGNRTTVLEGMAACIQNGKIAAIGKPEELKAAYPGEEVKCYPGCSLMPGMIDMHVHISYCMEHMDYYNKDNREALSTLYAADRMRKTLEVGVTTVRDASSAYGIGTALKRAAADGYLKAPRIFACLQGICMTGGHGADALPGACIEADGVEECRKAVRLNLKRGADCIKALSSEGYRGAELNLEELTAIAQETHRFGKKAALHAGYGESLENGILAGFDSIEHGTNLTVEQARTMAEKGITWVPTVLVFNYAYQEGKKQLENLLMLADKPAVLQYLEEATEAYVKNLRTLYDTGVRVCTGTDTDCTTFKGASPVALECEYLVKCGLTPLEAVECATKNGADYLDMGNCLGQVKEGYIADVIVVEGDPSKDITALKNVRGVYQAGEQVC